MLPSAGWRRDFLAVKMGLSGGKQSIRAIRFDFYNDI
jgi:hypothetical protein